MASLILFLLLTVANAIVLPNPGGRYNVSLQVHAMTDNSRIDPYSPKNHRHHRKLLTSLFWPIEDASSCSTMLVSYMPPATAELYGAQASAIGLSNDTFSALSLEVCNAVKHKGCNAQARKPQYPLAVFSPGSGNSRLLYSAMAKSLASQGYVVITVDHPYDAAIVEFPDGSIIQGANISEDTSSLEKLTKVRAQDIAFVISQLQGTLIQSSLKQLPGSIDTSKIVLYGHSLGGASAAAVMLSHSQVRAGVNLDGGLFEPALSKGLSKPFFLLGRPNHDSEDATWSQFWKYLCGPKVEGEVSGTVHGSFTDLPLVMSVLGLPDAAKSQLASVVGTIDASKLSKILTKTLSAFFVSVFEKNPEHFRKTANGYTELSIVKSKF